ncbi:MAG TPA: imidazole glycerol phosphate synthase subunit HisH [Thermoanaerobaculia bacterium]|nr:imidazole glycerol phosphate synthase subunit HisH [Thermoanaerobaculia bacterium]
MTTPPRPPVTLVDYGVGNTASVIRAFRRLGAEVDFTADLDRVASARRLVLPGVAAFQPAMNRLLETGLESAVRAAVKRGGRLLGLCLGFQLLFEESEEHGVYRGLGLVQGRVRPFPARVRTPHVGWNQLLSRRPDGFVEGVPDGSWVYFVHSFRPEGVDAADIAAVCNHGGEFAAIVQRGNVWGCQFHPEKSSENGRLLLSNFLKEDAA